MIGYSHWTLSEPKVVDFNHVVFHVSRSSAWKLEAEGSGVHGHSPIDSMLETS